MRGSLVMLVLFAACDRGATTPPPRSGPGTASPSAVQPAASPPDLSDGLLVINWDASLLSELSTMISTGRAILLAGDRPLVNCHGPSERLGDEAVYTFRGAPLREEHRTIDGATLDATYVGTLDVTKFPRDTRRLEGECDGATHVVRAIDVGAFELSSSSTSQTKIEVPLGGGVVGGSRTSSSSASSKSGDRTACAAADPPPANCRAAVRLWLHPLAR